MANDEKLYAQAMKEWGKGWTDPILMIKAEVMASGNKDAIRFEYVKLRVEQIKSENLKELPLAIASGAMEGIRSIREAREQRAAEKKATQERLAAERLAAKEKRQEEQREFDREYFANVRKDREDEERIERENIERFGYHHSKTSPPSHNYQSSSTGPSYALAWIIVFSILGFFVVMALRNS